MGENDPDNSEPLDDDELVEKAKQANNGLAFTLRFERSYDSPALTERYETRYQAERALMANLAWWTQHDSEQMWRLFRRSELYREELEEHPEYRRNLIEDAIDLVGDDCYDPNFRGDAS